MTFSQFVEINPRVSLSKGEEYRHIEMELVISGHRYVRTNKRRKYTGGGSKFKTGDTLFARITPCLENGKIAQFIGEKNEIAFGSTEFFVFRAKEGISDPSYIYYLSFSDLIKKPAEKSMSGASGRQRADIKSIENLEIPEHTLPTQQKIASILSAYDDLIENNLKRIKILEELAQMIYREWFVNFRFPGHEKVKMVKSELGMIPEGWKVKTIGEVVETLGGGTPSTKIAEYWDNGDVSWYTPSDITKNNKIFIHDSEKKITNLGLQKSSARMFPDYSVMMTSRATVGEFAINTIPACTNQGFITCVPTERLSAYYIYFLLKEMKEKIISLAGGATYKEINRTTFRKIQIIVPDKSIMDEFTSLLKPMMNLIENLQIRIDNLRKTRDLLLPKLISGEIDVEKLNININGAIT